MPPKQTPLRINKPSHLSLPSTFKTTLALITFQLYLSPLDLLRCSVQNPHSSWHPPCDLQASGKFTEWLLSLNTTTISSSPPVQPDRTISRFSAPLSHLQEEATFSPQTQCENLDHTDLDWCSFLHFQWLWLKDHRFSQKSNTILPGTNSPACPFSSTDPNDSPILSPSLPCSGVCAPIYIPVTKFRSTSKITFECLLLYFGLKYFMYFPRPPLLNRKYFQLKNDTFKILAYIPPKS